MKNQPEESLAVLSQTIAMHAKQFADNEWRNECAKILSEILSNSGITDTLSIDGRELPVESVTKAIRERLSHRSKELMQKLTNQVVAAALKEKTDEAGDLLQIDRDLTTLRSFRGQTTSQSLPQERIQGTISS